MLKGVIGVGGTGAVIVAVMWRGCFDHPFLLADNRHFTFYLWRWLLGRGAVRVAASPVVAYALWYIHGRLGEWREVGDGRWEVGGRGGDWGVGV